MTEWFRGESQVRKKKGLTRRARRTRRFLVPFPLLSRQGVMDGADGVAPVDEARAGAGRRERERDGMRQDAIRVFWRRMRIAR
jgi:hypothetical protein